MAFIDWFNRGDNSEEISNGAFYLLGASVPIHVGLLSVGSLYDTGSTASMFFGLWVLSFLVFPILGYIDLRRVREAGHWQPHVRGALWVFGLAIPFLATSVAVTYLLRRHELVTHDGPWGKWLYVICGAGAILIISWLIAAIFGNPSIDGNAPAQNAAIAVILSLTLLPGLAAYFDLKHLRRTSAQYSLRHWLWIPGLVVWLVRFPVLIGYWIWRRQVPDIQETITRAESQLEEAGQYLDKGTEALNNGRYKSALSNYERVEDILDQMWDTISPIQESSDVLPPRLAVVVAELEDTQASLDVRQNQAEIAQLIEHAQDEFESGNLGSAIEKFQIAISRCEDALDVADDEIIREKFERAREGREKAQEKFFETELKPLADRIESTYSEGVNALEANDYETAADQFNAAREDVETFESRVEDYGLDRSLPVEPEEIDDKLTAVERQQVLTRDIDPLADRIESTYSVGIDALDDERYDAATERFDEVESDIDRLASLIDEHDLDRQLPVTRDDLAEAIQRVKRERARSRIESQLERASKKRQTVEAAMDDDEYDRAVEAVETALEHLDSAKSLIDNTDAVELDDEWNLEERQSSLRGLKGAAVRHQQEQRYREPLQDGDDYREKAIKAADENRFADAIDALESAREAYKEATQVAESLEIGDVDTVQDRLAEIAELRTDWKVKELSQRVTQERVNLNEDKRDRCLAAADALEDVAAEVDEVDIDRERDLEIIREEAHREQIKARLLAEREQANRAIEAFEEGDYATARDHFEAVVDTVANLRSEAEDVGVTEYDDAINRLASICETNADAARRAVLGMVDEPSVMSVDISLNESAQPTHRPSTAGVEGGVQENVSTGAAANHKLSTAIDDTLSEELSIHEQLDRIGSGGNADVYKVRLDTGEHAALKVPRWQGTLSAGMVERFADEAETWNKLDEHEHIVSLLGWGKQPYPWMLLEFLPASLADRIGILSEDQKFDVLIDVADALEFAHGRGVVHLDIKPENVLLTDADSPKVGDWGLSQFVLEHTRTQMGLTPPYSAPEQLTDRYGDINRRTDVYQFSVLAYRVLTGRLPFNADQPADLQNQILNDDPIPPSTIEPMLDAAVDDVILRGLSKSPEDRYEAVVLLRNELRTFAE